MAHFLNLDTSNNANAQQWFPVLSPSTMEPGLFTLTSPVPMHDSNVYMANDYSNIINGGDVNFGYPKYAISSGVQPEFEMAAALRGSNMHMQEAACAPTSALFEFDFNNQFGYLPPSPHSPASSLSPQAPSPAFDNAQAPSSSQSSNSAALGFGVPANFDLPVGSYSANTSPVSDANALSHKSAKRASMSVPSNAGSSSSLSDSSSPMISSPSKKHRSSISTKDFIPPDVTGLSKREARLVKNRAAAFLSRQRKREEFETMEIRVAELEQENARLQALLTSSTSNDATSPKSSAVAALRAQLTASQQRERELVAQINRLQSSLSTSSPSLSSSSGSQSPSSPAFSAISSSSSLSSMQDQHMRQKSSAWNHEDVFEHEPELDSSPPTSSSSEASTPLMNGYAPLTY